jgi:DNA-binding transcriptional LysR family regulator
LELRHIRYFIAVAEELNFSRAASRLETAQPSLSQQIRQLEDEIGVELFDRTRRQIELTPAGEEFLPEARAIVAQLELATANAREVGRGLRGELRIVYTASAMMSGLPAAIRAYRLGHPEVRISLRAMSLPAVVNALRTRDADVGVALAQRDLSKDGDLVVRSIASVEVMMVVPEGHRLARRSAIAIEEIGQERLILFARQLADIYDVTLRLCRERGFVPSAIQEVDRVETVLGLVAAAEGVSIIPRVYESLGFRGIAYLALNPSTVPFTFVVAKNAAVTSVLANEFADACSRIANESFVAAPARAVPAS